MHVRGMPHQPEYKPCFFSQNWYYYSQGTAYKQFLNKTYFLTLFGHFVNSKKYIYRSTVIPNLNSCEFIFNVIFQNSMLYLFCVQIITESKSTHITKVSCKMWRIHINDSDYGKTHVQDTPNLSYNSQVLVVI
jgi:hypothetical protein